MTQTVQDILKQAKLYSDGQLYTFVRLPASAITAASGLVASIGEAFCGLIVDKDEVSLMIPAEAWADFQQRFVDSQVASQQYRLVTFDLVLDMDLIGFMAYVSAALAEANVSILPMAAFSRDHLFVQAKDFEAAMSTLKSLQSN